MPKRMPNIVIRPLALDDIRQARERMAGTMIRTALTEPARKAPYA